MDGGHERMMDTRRYFATGSRSGKKEHTNTTTSTLISQINKLDVLVKGGTGLAGEPFEELLSLLLKVTDGYGIRGGGGHDGQRWLVKC